jgi:streptomycin 3"-adenylyltransferase
VSQFGWHNCPTPIRTQVNTLIAACRDLIGDNLIGVYLHGSLASGCHNPDRSDIDLLMVVEQGLPVETKRTIAELFLRLQGQPRQLEVSVLTLAQLHPWQYPTPFDFHNGDWIEGDLASGAWQHWNDSVRTDPDLAAHITILNHRGLCLFGQPIAQVFPPVPVEHYRASILQDFDWGLERIGQRPLYFVLNACRIAAFLQEGLILSKDEGGQWGLRHAPETANAVIEAALRVYRGEMPETELDPSSLSPFIAWVTPLIKPN